MNYWWVNQNQTYEAETKGGYIWSPKKNKNGARNQFYENMREVCPGDRVFSFRRKMISSIGIATSNCYEAPKPDEFGSAGQNWDIVGWRVDVTFRELEHPIKPKDHMAKIGPLLPGKYSPLQENGDGLQSVYLAVLSNDFSSLLVNLLLEADNDLDFKVALNGTNNSANTYQNLENLAAEEIQQSSGISATEKSQLVMSRIGQGKFRQNVMLVESKCRVTGVSDTRFLIASHIKPWRSSANGERLDGENGLMLTPNVDLLFDRGLISFADDGKLLISPVVGNSTLSQLGIRNEHELNVGGFTDGQQRYLAYHRREIFLKAGAS